MFQEYLGIFSYLDILFKLSLLFFLLSFFLPSNVLVSCSIEYKHVSIFFRGTKYILSFTLNLYILSYVK